MLSHWEQCNKYIVACSRRFASPPPHLLLLLLLLLNRAAEWTRELAAGQCNIFRKIQT